MFSEKMNWKLLVAVAVIAGTLGLLALTEQGRQYAIFLGRGAGSLIGSVLKIYPGKTFNFDLTLNKEALYGQSFSLPDSNLTISGEASSIKIDGKTWNFEDGKVEIEMAGSGDFTFTTEGRVRLNVNAREFKLGEWSTNDVKVEVELTPTAFSFGNVKNDMINITSASGTILKALDETTVTANFTKANLQIDNFSGLVGLENQTLRLAGTATDIKGI
jgi:hypothetical protein